MLVSSFNLLQSFNHTPYLFSKKWFKSEINSFCIWTQFPCSLLPFPSNPSFSQKKVNNASTALVEGLNCKRPIPICRLFFRIDLLMDIAALCLTDFIDWRYIHSLVGIFDPACELLPP